MKHAAPDDERDKELMLRVAQGDAAAFRHLFAGHYPTVVRFLSRRMERKADAEDLAQTVFLRVWTGAAAFRGEASVRTFLRGVARNVHRESLARQPRVEGFGTELAPLAADACPYCPRGCRVDRAETTACRLEHDLRLARAIASLPETIREAIRLRVVEKRGAAEAARLAGCAPGTLRRRLVWAFRRLRRCLDQA